MGAIRVEPGTGFWLVQVRQRNFFGQPRYWAECANCGWRCHEKMHVDKRAADRHADGHVCEDGPVVGTRPPQRPHGNSRAAREGREHGKAKAAAGAA